MLFKREVKVRSSAEARRSEILEAAVRVIADGGPDAITFRKVAGRAKVPLGSLTYYFESREDLIREAFRFYLSEIIAFMSGIEDTKPRRTSADLIDLVLEVAEREFSDDPAMVRVEYELILYAARDPQLAREFNTYERWMQSRLADPLEALRVARPFDAARTIIDVTRGFEIERMTHPSAPLEDLERRLKLVIDALIDQGPDSGSYSRKRYERRVHESNRKRRSVS